MKNSKVEGFGCGFWVLGGLVVVLRRGCTLSESQKVKSAILLESINGIFKGVRFLAFFLKSDRKAIILIVILNKGGAMVKKII